MLAYSAGLRVSEIVALKVRDIDSDRMCIKVSRAKGKKDRVVVLSDVLLMNCENIIWPTGRRNIYLREPKAALMLCGACSRYSRMRKKRRGSGNRAVYTVCATVMQHIYWKPELISGLSRICWDIIAY